MSRCRAAPVPPLPVLLLLAIILGVQQDSGRAIPRAEGTQLATVAACESSKPRMDVAVPTLNCKHHVLTFSLHRTATLANLPAAYRD